MCRCRLYPICASLDTVAQRERVVVFAEHSAAKLFYRANRSLRSTGRGNVDGSLKMLGALRAGSRLCGMRTTYTVTHIGQKFNSITDIVDASTEKQLSGSDGVLRRGL